MIYVFYAFAALLVWFSYRSFTGGLKYLAYFRTELARPVQVSNLPVTLIVPCRGDEDGLADNLKALLSQSHPTYETIFVVDDDLDPAVPVIRSAIADAKGTASLVTAAKATNSGQKVENLREAVLHASPASKVFAFADSDARPSRAWLSSLIVPLDDPSVGAASGYRWFISRPPTFAGELRSTWNASIASSMGPNLASNFCWGGSMAIRRDTFERIDMRTKWRGTVSDDFAVTRAIRQAGLSIVFVPRALIPSFGGCTLREMFEFTNRQMKITRVYSPDLWALAFLGSAVFVGVMMSSIGIIAAGPVDTVRVAAAIAVVVLVSFFSLGKAWLRMQAVRLALAGHTDEVDRQMLPQLTLWLAAPVLYLVNCVIAGVSRRIIWRGTAYELKSPTETVIIAP